MVETIYGIFVLLSSHGLCVVAWKRRRVWEDGQRKLGDRLTKPEGQDYISISEPFQTKLRNLSECSCNPLEC